MRRLCVWLIAALLLLAGVGCSKAKPGPAPEPPNPAPSPAPTPAPPPRQPPAPPPPSEPADAPQQSRRVVESFMIARMEGRMDHAQAWLTPRAQAAGGIRLSTAADRFAGYNIWLESKSGASYQYRVQTLLSYHDRPYSRYLVEFITVKRNGTTYLIDEIEYVGQREAVAQDADRRLALKWLTREKQLLAVADLPDQFQPYGSSSSFGVGKNRFTALALSPDGKHVAFGSGYLHGFLGVLTLSFDGDELNTNPLMDGLDLYFEGVAREMVWSPDGKYLAVLVDEPSGFRVLHVWDMSRHKRLLIQGFPVVPGSWQVFDPQWASDGRLVFRIRTSGGTLGPYYYNPQTERVETN